MKEGDILARKIRLACTILMVLYTCSRLPFPLLVIPLCGLTIVHASKELEEIRNESKGKKRNKKVKRTATKK